MPELNQLRLFYFLAVIFIQINNRFCTCTISFLDFNDGRPMQITHNLRLQKMCIVYMIFVEIQRIVEFSMLAGGK